MVTAEWWRAMATELAETSRTVEAERTKAWRSVVKIRAAEQEWQAALLRYEMMISQERAEKEETREVQDEREGLERAKALHRVLPDELWRV